MVSVTNGGEEGIMPQIIWDTAETGLCYYGNAFTYCNPLHVVIATVIAIAAIVATYLLIDERFWAWCYK